MKKNQQTTSIETEEVFEEDSLPEMQTPDPFDSTKYEILFNTNEVSILDQQASNQKENSDNPNREENLSKDVPEEVLLEEQNSDSISGEENVSANVPEESLSEEVSEKILPEDQNSDNPNEAESISENASEEMLDDYINKLSKLSNQYIFNSHIESIVNNYHLTINVYKN